MAEKKGTTTQATTEDTSTVLSADVANSKYKKNPDPNPDNVSPAPGPSTIQEIGTP